MSNLSELVVCLMIDTNSVHGKDNDDRNVSRDVTGTLARTLQQTNQPRDTILKNNTSSSITKYRVL